MRLWVPFGFCPVRHALTQTPAGSEFIAPGAVKKPFAPASADQVSCCFPIIWLNLLLDNNSTYIYL